MVEFHPNELTTKARRIPTLQRRFKMGGLLFSNFFRHNFWEDTHQTREYATRIASSFNKFILAERVVYCSLMVNNFVFSIQYFPGGRGILDREEKKL
mmetsp:Transcript_57490/g.67133  ORF Transcript_57490/g.67133 Transcript_57490/m.67133 type:complete len:97 (+) Transcript_57490:161-451(+)